MTTALIVALASSMPPHLLEDLTILKNTSERLLTMAEKVEG